MSGKEFKILLVEDNKDDAFFLQELLATIKFFKNNNISFTLINKSYCKDAVKYLEQNRTDLVFLDLNLPDGRGLATIDYFKSYLNQTPFIILTGLDDEQTAVNAVKIGIQDYLVKGQITSESLSRSISYAIERFNYIKALQNSENRFRILFNDVSDALVVFEFNEKKNLAKFLELNQMTLDLFKYSRESLLEINPEEIFEFDQNLTFKDFLNKIKKEKTQLIECKLINGEQKKIFIEIDAHLTYLQEKECYLCVIRDISLRKRTDSALNFDHSLMVLLKNLNEVQKFKPEE